MISTVVLSSIHIIVSGSHKYVIEGTKKIRLQQDFSLIELMLSTKIRQSTKGQHEIFNNYSDYIGGQSSQTFGSCLKLKYISGDSVVLYQDNLDFKIVASDLTITNLVPGVVDSLIFTDSTSAIHTKLSLSQGNWGLENTLLAAFRNSISSDLEGRRCELVIQAGQVPGNLTDFPVLFTEATLPSEMFDADGSYPALDGGDDIKFTSDQAGDNRLSCEIVAFTTDNDPANGSAEIWAKVPSISSSSNTSIWVRYNIAGGTQPAPEAPFGSESVWDDDYELVQHMNEDPSGAAPQMMDATSNDYDCESQGSMTSGDLVAGKIGGSLDFDGNNDRVRNTTMVSSVSLTFEAWIYPDRFRGSYNTVIEFGDDKPWFGALKKGKLGFFRGSGGIQTIDKMTRNIFNHIVATHDGSTLRIWINGDEDLPPGTLNRSDTATGLGIAHRGTDTYFDGKIDEVRISNIVRSADWIETGYNNQNSPSTFIIEGTPETP